MKIQFGNYTVNGTHGDWIVSETKTVTKKGQEIGNEYEADNRYFGTLYQALFYLLNAKLSESDLVDVRELKDLINKHCREIKNIVEGL